MGNLLDFISNICPITGNSLADTFLFFLIGSVAFLIAWAITGGSASSVGYNSSLMSLIHWVVRVIVFFVLFGFFLGIVHFVRRFSSLEWWGYLIFGISTALIIGGIVFLRIRFKKKKPALDGE